MVLRASLLHKAFLSCNFLVVSVCSASDGMDDQMPFICASEKSDFPYCLQTNGTCLASHDPMYSRALLKELTPLVLTNVFFASVSGAVGAATAGDPKKSLKGIAYATLAGLGFGVSLSLGVDCHTRPLQAGILHQFLLVGTSALAGALLGDVYS